MGQSTEFLEQHPRLAARREAASQRLTNVAKSLREAPSFANQPLVAFAAGSLSRGEAGKGSDLDVFVTTDDPALAHSRLCTFELISDLIRVNREHEFPPFSNDGQYLRVYSLKELSSQIGSSSDDGDNCFTARMLMLLEAQPLVSEDGFAQQQHELVSTYFRDGAGKSDFRPLFLLNDLLRYWRTLCLNYEHTRHDVDRPWRKKNVNLKFSRMVTVFGTALPLLCDPDQCQPGAPLWSLSPLSRLAYGLDALGDAELLARWPAFLDAYEDFLKWKEMDDIETKLHALKSEIRAKAAVVSGLVYDALSHESIPLELRRYLVL